MRSKKESKECNWLLRNLIDAIEFEVNKPLILQGVVLYGSKSNRYTYKIEVKLLSKTKATLAHVLQKTITESTKEFQVNFEKPFMIEPFENYTIWLKMVGPNGYRGDYSDCVNYEDYKFKFYQSGECTNGTSVHCGQIPGLVCRLEK